jgi:pyruvate dehydrogenase E1 component
VARSWRLATTCARCRTRSPHWVPEDDYASLGADGFGFADTRAAARRFFHIDGPSGVVKALQMLADRGEIDPQSPQAAQKYRIDDVTAGTSGNAGGDA